MSCVNLTVTDANGGDVTVNGIVPDEAPDPAGTTWTSAPVDLSGLADGTLTISGSYTIPDGLGTAEIGGAALRVQKDTVVPIGAPTASPPAGTYPVGAQRPRADGQ